MLQYEIIGLVVCFIATSFFSAAEAALLSIGADRARQLIEEAFNEYDSARARNASA